MIRPFKGTVLVKWLPTQPSSIIALPDAYERSGSANPDLLDPRDVFKDDLGNRGVDVGRVVGIDAVDAREMEIEVGMVVVYRKGAVVEGRLGDGSQAMRRASMLAEACGCGGYVFPVPVLEVLAEYVASEVAPGDVA